MADPLRAIVRRVDLEPKKDFLDVPGLHTWAHVFLRPREGPEIDAYTTDPALQAAVLTAWRPPPDPDRPDFPPLVEFQYEEIEDVKRLTRVALDYETP